MDIIERLQEIISYESLTVSSFAKKIGVGDQTIRGIVVQKRNKPGFDILARVIQTFNWLDAEWLMTGNGSMVKPEEVTRSDSHPSLTELIQYIREKDRKIEQLIEEKTELKVKFEMFQQNGPQLNNDNHTTIIRTMERER